MRNIVPQPEHFPASPCAGHAPLTITLTLAILLTTSACGFKLRGPVEIPPELNPMYIQSSPGSPMRGAVVQQLQGSQVRLASGPQDARVIVRIGNESRTSRVVAVDQNGKVLASELHYRVTFDAVDPSGKQLVPQQNIDVVRSYENPDVEVLGKESEAALIYREMFTDAANRILDRLRAALL
jgi:LPS-assembly lipoprotein